MAGPDDYLKPQTVARAFGLSVSTIKRWADSGTLHAVRTAGKHRLIARSEAIRLARELGIDPARLRDTQGLPPADIAAVDEGSCEKLCQLLREGRGQQARILVHSIYSSGCGAATLADQLIRPVMARIGHGWMTGALDVYQEHQASHIVASCNRGAD